MSNKILELREQIDAIDTQLVELLARRQLLAKDIGVEKIASKTEIHQEDRWQTILKNIKAQAKQKNLPENMIVEIYQIIHHYSKLIQERIL